jgi:regulator of sigma D
MSEEKNHPGEDRRRQTKTAIDRLLEERQEVLVCYEQVAGIQPYSEKSKSPELLQKFSQLLMDYIAAGHFGLYQRITEGSERRRKVLEVAEKIYPSIAKTTEKALDFNDVYDKAEKSDAFDAVSERLSDLGEVLAHRIELEDKLITAMMQKKEGTD